MARISLNLGSPATEILLQKGQVWRAEGDLRGEMIQCQEGMLWITQQGDLFDYFVNSGERFWVTRPGTILVESIQDARFNSTRSILPKLEPVYAHLGTD